MSPITRDHTPIRVGDYWVNDRTGVMVQIMDVDLSGNCRVQNILEPLDSEYKPLTQSALTSALWRRIQPET